MKKIQLPKINIKKIFKAVLNHLKLIGFGVSILLVITFGIFLYRNFYVTIISAREIIVLESELSKSKVNIHALEKVETTFLQKQQIPQYTWDEVVYALYPAPEIDTDTSTETVDETTDQTTNGPTDTVVPQTSF